MAMNETQFKFAVGWLAVIVIILALAGFIYGGDLAIIDYTPPNEPSVLDLGLNFIVLFINAIVGVIRVMTFTLPNMPLIFNIIFGSLFMLMNFVWFLAIYPFLARVVELVLKGVEILTPDWL